MTRRTIEPAPAPPRGVLAPVALAALVACGGSPSSVEVPVEERVTLDRTDDVAGPQIHAVYVVCDDCRDLRYDTDGTLERSLIDLQSWLVTRAGLRLRLDTYGGRPDISFARISAEEAALKGLGRRLVDELWEQVRRSGLERSGKKYVLFYQGAGDRCGSAQFGGRAALMSMGRGLNLCSPFAGRYGDFGRATLHEILHTLGFVDPAAPNHNDSVPFHVMDDDDDIMYSGPHWLPRVLDAGGDDYAGPAVPRGVKRLSDSPFVEVDR